jgi:Ribosome biogenesis regulatory protein (RRS1)
LQYFYILIYRAINPQKPNPILFDLGNFTAFDVNPLSSTILTNEDSLKSNTRDTTQLLINEFLTLRRSSTLEGVYIQLPAPTTPLPREKPVFPPQQAILTLAAQTKTTHEMGIICQEEGNSKQKDAEYSLR